MTAPLIEAKGVEVVYGARRGLIGARPGTRVLHGVDLSIGKAETVGIVGESGSGKTTSDARCCASSNPRRARSASPARTSPTALRRRCARSGGGCR